MKKVQFWKLENPQIIQKITGIKIIRFLHHCPSHQSSPDQTFRGLFMDVFFFDELDKNDV